MMASVITTGPAALRVEAEFHTARDLAGLIWSSEDLLDHPLLGDGADFRLTNLKGTKLA